MENKEEIEKAKERCNSIVEFCKNNKECQKNKICSDCYIEVEDVQKIEILLRYIEELEEIKGMKEAIELAGIEIKDLLKFKYENKTLKKGQASLMASRKKWKDRYYKLRKKSNKQSKIIDEMAEYLAIVRDCPNEDKGVNLDCENRCTNDDGIYAECWKLYFEKKVEEK